MPFWKIFFFPILFIAQYDANETCLKTIEEICLRPPHPPALLRMFPLKMSEPDNAPHDELEQHLLSRSARDPEVQTFLSDYARCKKQRGKRFIGSVVEYHVFQPLSASQWAFSSLDEKKSFSDILQSLKPALNEDTSDGAHFLWVFAKPLAGNLFELTIMKCSVIQYLR